MFRLARLGRTGPQLWQSTAHWRAHSTAVSRSSDVFQTLKERGFVHQVAGSPDFLSKCDPKTTGVYVGIDPTAQSLHVGHLVPFMALFWMYLHGFKTVTLVGGFTAKVGDPTWRTTARNQMDETEQLSNVSRMEQQLASIWTNVNALGSKYGHGQSFGSQNTRNNQDWLGRVLGSDILLLMGKGLRMGPLLSRDSVRSRLESDDGMAVSEFGYPLFQAWDWWHMKQNENVRIQIGGADQFGNIVTGVEALKYLSKTISDAAGPQTPPNSDALMGFTVPLLTTSSGEKFGKSAGNAVWLDAELTTPFDLYAYMLCTTDDDVERLLKLFTFLSTEEIYEIMKIQQKDASQRVAQHRLAYEFLCLAHDADSAEETAALHKSRASQRRVVNVSTLLSDRTPEATMLTIKEQDLDDSIPSDLLHFAGLAETKSEARRLVASQGAYIGIPNSDGESLEWHSISKSDNQQKGFVKQHVLWKGNEGLLLLRAGKMRVQQIRVTKTE